MDITQIKSILSNLYKSMEESSKNNGVAEYYLNTGQTITKVTYNTTELLKQIKYWERKLNEYSQNNIISIRDENT